MRQKIQTFLLMLAGIFVLVHTFVPHHHHLESIILEMNDDHHHPCGEGELDEIIVTACIKQQAIDFQSLFIPLECIEPTFAEVPEPIFVEDFTAIAVDQPYEYSSFVHSSQGLRAPPVIFG